MDFGQKNPCSRTGGQMWSRGKKWPLNKTRDKALHQALELLFTVVTKDPSTTSAVICDFYVTFMSRVQYLRPDNDGAFSCNPSIGGVG